MITYATCVTNFFRTIVSSLQRGLMLGLIHIYETLKQVQGAIFTRSIYSCLHMICVNTWRKLNIVMLSKITDKAVSHRAMMEDGDENRNDFRRDYF